MFSRLFRRGLATVAPLVIAVAVANTADAGAPPIDPPGGGAARGGPAEVVGADEPDAVPGQYIVVFKKRAPAGAVREGRAEVARRGGRVDRDFTNALTGFSPSLPPPAVEALRHNPNVDFIEADAVVMADETQTGAT